MSCDQRRSQRVNKTNPKFVERKIKFNDRRFKFSVVLAQSCYSVPFLGPTHTQGTGGYWGPFLIMLWAAHKLHQQNEKLEDESGMNRIPSPADL